MRRLVTLVAAIVLVDTMFYAAISPLLPYYTHHFHVHKPAAGMLAAAYPAGTLLGSLPAGWLAARVGVRRAVLSGLGLMIVSSLGFGFAHSIAMLDTARFLQGIGGAASWAGGLAWLIARAPATRRGEMIGAALAAAIFGALLGPALGTLASQTSPELAFSLVAAIGLGLCGFTLAEPAPSRRGAGGKAALGAALRTWDVRTGMWLTTLGALFYGTLAVLVPLRFDRLGAGSVAIGVAFLLGAAAAGLASPLIGRLSDRRGWWPPARVGLTASAIVALLLPLPTSAALLFAVVVLGDPVFGFAYPSAGAMISHGSERVGLDQGYAFALFNLAWGVGQVVGDAGSAGVAQASSDAVPYTLLAGVALLTLATLRRSGARAQPAAELVS